MLNLKVNHHKVLVLMLMLFVVSLLLSSCEGEGEGDILQRPLTVSPDRLSPTSGPTANLQIPATLPSRLQTPLPAASVPITSEGAAVGTSTQTLTVATPPLSSSTLAPLPTVITG